LRDADPVRVIYTSGTSGEAKGVVLTAGNVGHMLPCADGRLDALMAGARGPERVFHYLPFCFAGSWILLLTSLRRGSLLALCADLDRLGDELRAADPHYVLNVPAVLERMRAAVEKGLVGRGGIALALHRRAGRSRFCRALARLLVYPFVRKRMGSGLKALICGSAPLSEETQRFFLGLGIPVLQVYGLTETTAICTMDVPGAIVPGRVGPAVAGLEMRVDEEGEIVVRGPNVFPGYWNRADETAEALRDGWLRTGDQGDVDPSGNWRIHGRLKNLLVLDTGHKVAPEPLEWRLKAALPSARQVMLAGNGRRFVAALVTGEVQPPQVAEALEELNGGLPHYQRVRAFHVSREPFTVENGLLTANGKLRRGAIAARFAAELDELFSRTSA
ncbi:MAG: AMP-binding protein, partial [Planctomycetota bacterium]